MIFLVLKLIVDRKYSLSYQRQTFQLLLDDLSISWYKELFNSVLDYRIKAQGTAEQLVGGLGFAFLGGKWEHICQNRRDF